jgi:glyoxylase-like metal-dependent hydrolase (beta-lactamase superfamily II)
VNTYLIYDGGGECIIIDPACSDASENSVLDQFIGDKKLKPVSQVFTHCHVDHIPGMAHIFHKYGLKPLMHPESLKFLHRANEQGRMFGFMVDEIVEPEVFINEGETLQAGGFSLEILYTPGHADGHICLVCREGKFVITGDVLFRESIGRTDFVTGDFDLLSANIKNKLYILDKDFTVFPGHGPSTTVGNEKKYNPFVRG